jgi:hypothetical protein
MTGRHPLPPVSADERSTLEAFLDYFRSVLLRKAEGLDESQARLRVGASTLDILGLVRHMALVEQWWFTKAFAGSDEADLWANDWPARQWSTHEPARRMPSSGTSTHTPSHLDMVRGCECPAATRHQHSSAPAQRCRTGGAAAAVAARCDGG